MHREKSLSEENLVVDAAAATAKNAAHSSAKMNSLLDHLGLSIVRRHHELIRFCILT